MSQELRIAIIGTGWFGRMHGQKLAKLEGVRVVAFVGTSLEKAETAAREHAGATGYTSVDELLDKEKLDAAYICVPPFAHGEMELKLAAKGIPFLVEKPLSSEEVGPEKVAALVQSSGLITSVGYHFRYSDAAIKARELLQGQKVGMTLGYWMGSMPMVGWWRKMEGSGGQFVEQTTHMVDLLRYVTRDEVTSVYAAYGSQIQAALVEGVTVPDIGSVTLKMRSGAIATISNTCILPAGDKVGLHLYTDHGVLEVHSDKLIQIERAIRKEYQNQSDPYDRENQAFLHAVRTGDASGILSTYEDALVTHRITMAANQSAQTGQAIWLES